MMSPEMGWVFFAGYCRSFWGDPVVISVGVKRLEERLGADRGLSHRVAILEKNLIRNKKVVKVNYLCLTRSPEKCQEK
jgi:hypothetical protein